MPANCLQELEDIQLQRFVVWNVAYVHKYMYLSAKECIQRPLQQLDAEMGIIKSSANLRMSW